MEMPAGMTPPAQPGGTEMSAIHLTLMLKILAILELIIKALVIILAR
jgi:hypothetical protein